MGAILTQTDENGHHRVIEYASRALTPSQTKYSNSAREAMGIVWALQHFRYYVYGCDPIVYCDCSCLAYIWKNTNRLPDTVHLRDWVSRLMQYNPKLLHKPGKMMAIPDALSRHYVAYAENEKMDAATDLLGELVLMAEKYAHDQQISLKVQENLLKNSPLDDETPMDIANDIRSITQMVKRPEKCGQDLVSLEGNDFDCPEEREANPSQDPEELAENELNRKNNEKETLSWLALEQRLDPNLEEIIQFKISGQLPLIRARAEYVKATTHYYIMDEYGVLRKVNERQLMCKEPPAMLPRQLWDEVIEAYHDNKTMGGHRKFGKLYEMIKSKYFFHGMMQYIKAYTRTCTNCQRYSTDKRKRAPLKPYHTSYPGVLVNVDCTKGPKLRTRRGHTHILTIIDSFTGYVRLYPVKGPDAKTVARSLYHYVCMHGMPLRIVSDNGSEFVNTLVQELALLLGMKWNKIAPYNSKANGKVENAHKGVQSIIRAYLDEFPNDWDDMLPLAEFCINTSISEVTKYSPFFLFYGRHPNIPLDVFYENVVPPDVMVEKYVKDLMDNRKKVFQAVLKAKERAAEKYQKRYAEANKQLVNDPFRVGDYVRIRNEKRKGPEGKKYVPLFSTDYFIVSKVLSGTTVEIQDIKREKPPITQNIAVLRRIYLRHEVILDHQRKTINQTEKVVEEMMLDDDPDNELPMDEDDQNPYFEVVDLLDKKVKDGVIYYKVWWKGYAKNKATWQPAENVTEDVIQKYEDKQKRIQEQKAREGSGSEKPRRSTHFRR